MIDCAKHPVKKFARFLLDRCRDGSIRMVAVNVATDSAAPEKRSCNQRWCHSIGETAGVVRSSHQLIERRTARASFAIRRRRRERSCRTVEVRIHPIAIASNLIDIAKNQELILERREGLENTLESIRCTGLGIPNPKKTLKARVGTGLTVFAITVDGSISSNSGSPTATPPIPRRSVRREKVFFGISISCCGLRSGSDQLKYTEPNRSLQ